MAISLDPPLSPPYTSRVSPNGVDGLHGGTAVGADTKGGFAHVKMKPQSSSVARSRSWILVALVLGLMLVVAACGGGSRQSSSNQAPSSSASSASSSVSTPAPPSEPAPSQQASSAGSTAATASGSIELVATDEAGQFRFSPDRIEVAPGQQVTLRVVNRGASAHDFAVPVLGVETGQIDPGQEKTITFTAPSNPGEYRFVCTVPGHEQLGMHGTLVVRR